MASLVLLPCTCSGRAGLQRQSTRSRSALQAVWRAAALSTTASNHRSSWSSPSTSSAPGKSARARATARAAQQQLRYNFNPNPFDPAPPDAADRASYPVVTADDLKKYSNPPRKVRLLAREFIHDSLYNPHYGYFPKQAVIFDPDATSAQVAPAGAQDGAGRGEPSSLQLPSSPQPARRRRQGFDFARMRNMHDWDRAVAETYGVIEESSTSGGPGRQVWHTPTELFKPYYAQAVAHHLATEYKLSLFPYNDLNIYEIGAGNGSLMTGILDFLRASEPEVYQRTHYHTIEISKQLADLQSSRARRAGHSDKVQVVQQSIFDWDRVVSDPCFFLAFEVLDNLSHDVVRYTLDDNTPLQCMIEIDARGEFGEVYEPVTDPLIKRFLRIRRDIRRHSRTAHTSLHPILAKHPLLRRTYASLPFAPNLSPPDFLPTKSLSLLYKLRKNFPAHRILMSDFDYLPDAVPGRNAPVVQTRYEGKMVTCSTYLVSQGWFDIFFPTDFRFLRDMYDKVMAGEDRSTLEAEEKLGASDLGPGMGWENRRGLRILSHKQFLQRYGEPEYTMLQDGTNPMLDLYENAAFIF